MPDRSSKKKRKQSADPMLLTRAMIDQVTGHEEEPTKNPAAVALGRLGGLRGGKARAAKLSKARRAAIAKKAAKARWTKTRPKTKPKT